MPKEKKKEVVILTVGSKVKEHIAAKGLRSAGDLNAAISEHVVNLLDNAVIRAEANKRGTVKPCDL